MAEVPPAPVFSTGSLEWLKMAMYSLERQVTDLAYDTCQMKGCNVGEEEMKLAFQQVINGKAIR